MLVFIIFTPNYHANSKVLIARDKVHAHIFIVGKCTYIYECTTQWCTYMYDFSRKNMNYNYLLLMFN
jgi:hypothetical protein